MRLVYCGSFLFLLIILFSEAGVFAQEPPPPKDGKTEIKIGEPKYQGNPVQKASVPIIMQLDKNAAQFIGFTVSVKRDLPLWDPFGIIITENVPVEIVPGGIPQPGGPPVVTKINFNVVPSKTYKIEVKMRYKDNMNEESYVKDNKEITP